MVIDTGVNPAREHEFEIDPKYEFSAPRYYDFCKGETEEDATDAERWFQRTFSYAASPCVAKFKSVREMSMGCSLEDYIEVQKLVARISSEFTQEKQVGAASTAIPTTSADIVNSDQCCDGEKSLQLGLTSDPLKEEPCTPRGERIPQPSPQPSVDLKDSKPVSSVCNVPVKRHHSDMHKQSFKVPTATKNTKNASSRSANHTTMKRCLATNQKMDLREEQAKKKQKLEGGHCRQIWNMKTNVPPSQTLPTLTVPKEFHFNTERRAQIHKETGHCSSSSKVECSSSPFMSLAERIQRFQLEVPDRFRMQTLNHDNLSLPKNTILRLTQPKEPELETSLRARPPRVKSSAEQEDELLANLPKFKARPLNKKILEGPTLPALPRSTPQLPEFQEFNLRTMERALMHHGVSTSMEAPSTNPHSLSDLRESKTITGRRFPAQGEPYLETTARARPPKVKSTEEMEQEELARRPKFKARPLNKRIFSSRGDVGIFNVRKRQATRPQEFHFATDDRVHCHNTALTEQVNKMVSSFKLQIRKEESNLRPTIAEPFHLATEERGLIKESKFQMELHRKEVYEQNARIPRANELPYTTDFPVIPPKPNIRETTKPEPFQLESLLRHEQDQLRRMEEHARAEKELAEMRAFRAQPVLCNVPAFVPERSRKPLTEIHQFVFRAEARAVQREQFDRKYMEKRRQYEYQKEQQEAAKKAEEERAMIALRKENVLHPRPVPNFDTPFVPFRSTKELTQPVTPKLLTARPKDHRQPYHSSFPVCYMR